MAVNLLPEHDLRAALRPYRVAPEAFETAVRERLRAAEQRVDEPLARLSSLQRAAASLLPLQVITGATAKGAAAPIVPATGLYKALSYLALPAISFFVLLGATVVSAMKIHALRSQHGPAVEQEQALREGIRQWWHRHRWGARLVYALALVLMFLGATWALFMLLIVSFGVLLYVLTSFARLGLGNRQVIGQSCFTGLVLLSQMALIPSINSAGLHFVDPALVSVIFLGGALMLLPFLISGNSHIDLRVEKTSRWLYALVPAQLVVALIVWQFHPNLLILGFLLGAAFVLWGVIFYRRRLAGQRMTTASQRVFSVLFVVVVVPLMAWQLYPVLWRATPERINHYVESFHDAPYGSASWKQWEIVASWAIEEKIDPDLSGARKLLAREIAGKPNPFVLGSAFRLGMIEPDELHRFDDLAKRRRRLCDDPHHILENRAITSLDQRDWVIRASVLGGDLSPAERDLLAKRLHATLDGLSEKTNNVLQTALRATQLLEVIGRPVDPAQYRARVHDWLRESFSDRSGGFQPAGGFKQYVSARFGSPDATSDAVELMAIYGIPRGLDLNWVRSYLRPDRHRHGVRKWIVAVTRDRLNGLPGAEQPTWLEILYYERSLLAAAVLVGMCIYATVVSPTPRIVDTGEEPTTADSA